MRWCAEDLGWSLRWHTWLSLVVRSDIYTFLPATVSGIAELRSEGNT